ncbi:hypothetical protein COCON_G00098990 [Conger conger]|uniref:Uncharacterized protein n=1 Tax=Conger conger TaxID=82655 RepID=A0A9Q1DMS2_CONCO|nr:hypothetical protein COCON_G00098990 [Conger conger]
MECLAWKLAGGLPVPMEILKVVALVHFRKALLAKLQPSLKRQTGYFSTVYATPGVAFVLFKEHSGTEVKNTIGTTAASRTESTNTIDSAL